MLDIVQLFIFTMKVLNVSTTSVTENQFSQKCDRNIYQLWSQKEVTCYSEKEKNKKNKKASDLVRVQNN